MTGTQLYAQLLDAGATLHLNPQGQLSVKPAPVAERYRSAIQAHVCHLLVCAATHEVQRLLQAKHLTFSQIRPVVSLQMLNAACVGGDVATCRQAAVTYVTAWRKWLEGDTHVHRV